MEEKDIIANLISLDVHAAEISETRKKELADLKNKFLEEELSIIKRYKEQIEEENKTIVQKIEQETEQEVNRLRIENKQLLANMQQKLEKYLKDIVDEIIEQIFKIDRGHDV